MKTQWNEMKWNHNEKLSRVEWKKKKNLMLSTRNSLQTQTYRFKKSGVFILISDKAY